MYIILHQPLSTVQFLNIYVLMAIRCKGNTNIKKISVPFFYFSRSLGSVLKLGGTDGWRTGLGNRSLRSWWHIEMCVSFGRETHRTREIYIYIIYAHGVWRYTVVHAVGASWTVFRFMLYSEYFTVRLSYYFIIF